MKKNSRPFDRFISEVENYIGVLRMKYALRELRDEPFSLQFCLGQIDALNYVLRLGASIFNERLGEAVPDARSISEAESQALAIEQELLFKSLHKKGS